MRNKMKPLSKESVAFVLQQVEELRPFLTNEGTVEVVQKNVKAELKRMVKRDEDISEVKESTHCVLFKVKDQGSEIKLVGFGKSLEEAAQQAKKEAWKFLNSVTNEVIGDGDRVREINDIIQNKNTIH